MRYVFPCRLPPAMMDICILHEPAFLERGELFTEAAACRLQARLLNTVNQMQPKKEIFRDSLFAIFWMTDNYIPTRNRNVIPKFTKVQNLDEAFNFSLSSLRSIYFIRKS